MEDIVIFRPSKLYVSFDGNHKCCNNTLLKRVKCKFYQGSISFSQEIGFCEKCEKMYVLNLEEENLKLFCDYSIYDSSTGQKHTQKTTTNWKTRTPPTAGINTFDKNKGGSIYSPYQGGSCSGK